MRLYNVGTEAELPAVWRESTKVLRKMHRTLIQHRVNEVVDEIWDQIFLVVTRVLSEKVATIEFYIGNLKVLELEMHPFVFN